MDKIWHRGVIRYLQKKGLTTKEIHADMVSTLGDDAPALSTVKKWAAEFKRGGRALKMIRDQDVLPQPPPKKTLTAFIKW